MGEYTYETVWESQVVRQIVNLFQFFDCCFNLCIGMQYAESGKAQSEFYVFAGLSRYLQKLPVRHFDRFYGITPHNSRNTLRADGRGQTVTVRFGGQTDRSHQRLSG